MKHQRYLLDTNICAFWLRDKFGIKYRVNEVGMENCYISEITVAELIYGREYGKLKGGPKYRDEKLEQFFEDIESIGLTMVGSIFFYIGIRSLTNAKFMTYHFFHSIYCP